MFVTGLFPTSLVEQNGRRGRDHLLHRRPRVHPDGHTTRFDRRHREVDR